MATYDRPHLVRHAVDLFLRQTYPSLELVVVDDGPESLRDLLPDDARVRHIRLSRRMTIGAKRNIACEAATGALLANWDDDDWYAPWRIAYQVEELTKAGTDVCGLATLLYVDAVAGSGWRYRWPTGARPWAHDATLLYRRQFWERAPFPDTNHGIDCRTLWTSRPPQVHTLANESFYVGMVHDGNTSGKHVRGRLWTPVPLHEVEVLMEDDLDFYRAAFDRVVQTSRAR